MNVRDIIFKEFVKNGYARVKGKRVWNIANRSHLHLTPELSKGFLKLLDFEPYRKNVFDVERLPFNLSNVETIYGERGWNLKAFLKLKARC